MSTTPRILDHQPHGQDVIGRRQGTHCVTVEVSQSERDALVVGGRIGRPLLWQALSLQPSTEA
jgi:hypothetical protein